MISRVLATAFVLLVSANTLFDRPADKRSAGKDSIKVEVDRLLVGEEGRSVILLLRPEADNSSSEPVDRRRVLPLVIGIEEARSIGVAFNKMPMPRPLSHDLMKRIIEEYNGSVEGCVITKMEENIFYAELHLKRAGGEFIVDCRPSDAIALAMRSSAPVFVRRAVFEKHAIDPNKPAQPEKLPKA